LGEYLHRMQELYDFGGRYPNDPRICEELQILNEYIE
jgi:hypothetical protein